MPCPGDRGTDYIDEYVDEFYGGSWPDALKAFVLDVDNVWCPKWIRRNYEVQNQIDTLQSDATNKPQDAADALCKKCLMPNTNQESDKTCAEFPHAQKFKTSFQFDDGEPNVSEDDDRPETYDSLQWRKENREPWQLHSGLGPNLQAQASQGTPEPLPQVVNPTGHEWKTFRTFFQEFAPEAF